MIMFPHTVTVYLTGDEAPVTFEAATHITVLRGVFYDSSKAVNVRESGLTNADSVNLIIPFSVEAVDGVTGKKQTSPKKSMRPLWTRKSIGPSALAMTASLLRERSSDRA